LSLTDCMMNEHITRDFVSHRTLCNEQYPSGALFGKKSVSN
jgi:hypothetical protein